MSAIAVRLNAGERDRRAAAVAALFFYIGCRRIERLAPDTENGPHDGQQQHHVARVDQVEAKGPRRE